MLPREVTKVAHNALRSSAMKVRQRPGFRPEVFEFEPRVTPAVSWYSPPFVNPDHLWSTQAHLRVGSATSGFSVTITAPVDNGIPYPSSTTQINVTGSVLPGSTPVTLTATILNPNQGQQASR